MSTVDRGVRLYVEDANKFFATLNQANKAVDDFGKKSSGATAGVGSLDTKSAALAVTLGGLATKAISGVISGFAGMGQEIINVVGNYERLSASVTALVAKEIKNTQGITSMEQAMGMAAPRAEELLGWIRQLAIQSPFDQEGVAVAFKTALAYGFTTDQAQTLTSSLINFAAATGQSSAVLGQLAYPLGQIRGAGKLLTQDLRQLTNAGVDVGGILKSMGYTWEDVSKGIISSDEFLQAFVKTMNDDFGGAAKNTANTLQGLLNSLGDIKELGLIEFFSPLKDELVPILSQMTSKLQEMIPYISFAGEKLGAMARFAIDNKDAIFKMMAVVGTGVATFLLLSNATAIASGAMAILTGALAAVGAAIAFLLSPIGLVTVAVTALAGLFALSYDTIQARTQETANFAEDRFGQMADKMVQTSAQGTQQVADDWGEMGDKIAQTAAQKQEESHGWGYNIIIQFAQGMADAAIAVINVLIDIGNAIAGWLAPGSPPKILPEIDQWGTDAMNEWLGGFGKADFSIFKNLSDTLSSFIRDMGEGILPETGIIPAILGTRGALGGAIAELRKMGSVSQETFEKIYSAMGITNDTVKDYVKSMFAAEKASLAVAKAEQKLSDITAKFDKQLAPLTKRLAELYGEQEKDRIGDRKAELQEIIKNAQAEGNTEAVRRAQRELEILALEEQVDTVETKRKAEEDAARKELEAAKAKEQAAKEQMDMLKMQLDLQAEQNKLVKEQIALLEKLAEKSGGGGGGGGAKGGAGGVKPPGAGLNLPKIDLEDIGGAGDILDGLNKKMKSLGKDLGDIFAPVKKKLDELKGKWADVFIALRDDIVGPFNTGLKGDLDLSGNIISDFFNVMGKGLNEAGPFWDNLKLTMKSVFDAFGDWVNENYIIPFLDTLSTGTQENQTILQKWFTLLALGLHNAGELWENLKLTVISLIDWWNTEFYPQFEENWNQFQEIWALGKANLEELWENFKLTLGVFGEWFTINVIDPWNANVEQIRATWETGKTNLEELWNGFQLTLQTFIEWFNTNIVEVWRGNIENIKIIWAEGKKDLEEKWSAFKDAIGAVWTDIKKAVGTTMNEVVAKIKNMIDGEGGVLGWIKTKATDFYSAGVDMIQGLINGAGSLAQALINKVTSMVQAALDAMGDLLNFGSPSKVMMQRGKWTMEGFNMGLEDEGKKTSKIMTNSIPAPTYQPVQPVRPMSNIRNVTNNNQYNVTGIQNANVSNGMDARMLEVMVRRQMERSLAT